MMVPMPQVLSNLPEIASYAQKLEYQVPWSSTVTHIQRNLDNLYSQEELK